MSRVKSIRIRALRGILPESTLDLTRNGKPVSTVVYGANGTGKSSITDAWEWLYSGKIDHLSKEGAEEASYPHAEGKPPTFVEVTFSDDALGVIRRDFDPVRITKPPVRGHYELLRRMAPQSCHIRFADLARFALQTKSQRYDSLSQLMGFRLQVDFQKSLRRCQHKLNDEVIQGSTLVADRGAELKHTLGITALTRDSVHAAMSQAAARHGFPTSGTWGEIVAATAGMRTRVERDPLAQRLADLRLVGKDVRGSAWPQSPVEPLRRHENIAIPFKDRHETFRRLLTIDILELARRLVVDTEDFRCPLCGQVFPGDLHRHIVDEYAALDGLRQEYAAVERERLLALAAIESRQLSFAFDTELEARITNESWYSAFEHLREQLIALVREHAVLLNHLRRESRDLDTDELNAYRNALQLFLDSVALYNGQREAFLDGLRETYRKLEQDLDRRTLVSDFQLLEAGVRLWPTFEKSHRYLQGLQTTNADFASLVDAFVAASIADVDRRFGLISERVTTYFELLEAGTAGIGKPVLRLLRDQDRSVVPEVTLYGHTVSPAFKYLSESQLNSFGLAVFLASVQQFNPGFRFLLLDDIVNSFDAYKRPQLIRLLKVHFSDYQILLFTHDSVWRDRLLRECPSWRRVHIRKLGFVEGPYFADLVTPLEDIAQLLHDDKPKEAGQRLGPHMEEELQDVCERFEVDTKFRKRNDHTLDELLDRLRVRVQKKLRPNHPLSIALNELHIEAGFRNLCAHFKNPEADLTTPELQLVVNRWRAVVSLLRCGESQCGALLKWADPGFQCDCGKTVVTAAS
jgi:hypothetical protein